MPTCILKFSSDCAFSYSIKILQSKNQMFNNASDFLFSPSISGLKEDLKRKLYGQHLVIETVARALKAHVNAENPSKALVFSFHGWTGSGKNYVSEIVAQNFYLKGKSSQYVKLYLPDLHLYESNLTRFLAADLQTIIRTTVSACPRSLFLFDEVDKVPSDIISAVKPFIDYHKVVQGIDYSKSIFIFMR
uniref:Torsin-1B n=1 Tax=Romanomermis culicivorax TaxID=13658 RepID=A0A915JY29_ROMCU